MINNNSSVLCDFLLGFTHCQSHGNRHGNGHNYNRYRWHHEKKKTNFGAYAENMDEQSDRGFRFLLVGSFTMANSKSFLSPYEILPITQETKYLGKSSYFYHEIVYSVCSLESPHRGDSNEYTQHTFIV